MRSRSEEELVAGAAGIAVIGGSIASMAAGGAGAAMLDWLVVRHVR